MKKSHTSLLQNLTDIGILERGKIEEAVQMMPAVGKRNPVIMVIETATMILGIAVKSQDSTEISDPQKARAGVEVEVELTKENLEIITIDVDLLQSHQFLSC